MRAYLHSGTTSHYYKEIIHIKPMGFFDIETLHFLYSMLKLIIEGTIFQEKKANNINTF